MALTEGILRVVHQTSPFIIVVCSIAFSVAAACFVLPSRRTTLNASQQAVSKHLTAVICALHLSEAILHIFCASTGHDWTTESDAVIYTTLSFLVWLIISLIQTDAQRIYWLPNIATWMLALCLDIVICLLTFLWTKTGPLGPLQLSISLLRIAALVFLCIFNISPQAAAPRNDSEHQPLLRASNDHDVVYSTCSVDDKYEVSSESEQEEHIEKVGGWWAYLHEVKFLLPYIIPRDCRLQLYALIMFVLMLCERATMLLGPRLLGNIVQAISNQHTEGTLSREILIYIFAVKIPHDFMLEPARRWLGIRLFYRSYLDLLLALASHVAGLSFAFHENKQTGEIIAAIGQGEVLNKFVDDFVESTLPLVLDIVAAFGYLTYLFDVYVGLILATTYVFYGIVTYKGTVLCADARRKYRQTSRIEWNVLHEAIANWMSTFYLNRQDYQHRRLETLSRLELSEQEYNYDLSLSMRACQTLVTSLGYLAVLLRAAHLNTHTKDAVGNFVTLLFYWGLFTTPLFKLAHFYSSLAQVLVDVERLRQLMQTRPTVVDSEDAPNLVYRGGKVEYQNVNFSYDGQNKVIDNLNFAIEPGSTVAFVGQSGSGKTTTCDKLLFRAYDVTSGAILVDNQDIRDITQRSLRDTLGIVRQEPIFNNDTVLENVRYARLDASDAEVVAACKDAAIHDQIMRFPMGYNTRIGEHGIKLSGGERQRLAIAQLFLRNPSIVVLDEATSSVDNISESEIQESFARICKGRTTIIIAHRLSTVQHADHIFVLDRGTIAERGTHEELLDKHGKYFQLWHKTQAVKRLKRDLKRAESHEEQDLSYSTLLSDDTDYSDPPEIIQWDGAGSSKQVDQERPGMRNRIRSLKEKLSGKNRAEDSDYGDDEEDDEDLSPIRVMSPRATESSPPRTFSRHSSRRGSRRETKREKKARAASNTGSPVKPRTMSISAPMSSVVMESHGPMLDGQPATPSRIPVSVSPLATPVRTRQNTAREMLLSSPPQSPGRNAALRSHPILRHDEDGEGSGTTYHTTGTSIGSRRNTTL